MQDYTLNLHLYPYLYHYTNYYTTVLEYYDTITNYTNTYTTYITTMKTTITLHFAVLHTTLNNISKIFSPAEGYVTIIFKELPSLLEGVNPQYVEQDDMYILQLPYAPKMTFRN